MVKKNDGVLPSSTPFFLLYSLVVLLMFSLMPETGYTSEVMLPSSTASTATATAEQSINQNKIIIKADELIFHDEGQQLSADGNVKVWYQAMTLTADRAEADLDKQLVEAFGHVTITESGQTIKCVKLKYNLKTKSAEATGILFASDPWYYQGSSVEKVGEKKVVISDPLFTTCDARHPHYHLKAEQIEIILDEVLTARNVTLYVGNVPVFYLPWFKRSLDDKRPPFSIEFGYNDFEGMFAKMTYNYYFSKKNYGGLLFNLMEKKGVATGLNHYLDYMFWGSGHSDLSFLYVFDLVEGEEEITGKFNQQHRFSDKDVLKINLDYLSNRDLNREISSDLVDTYQQRSTIFYTHSDARYNYNVGIQEQQYYDSVRGKYYPSLRQLPSFNGALNSKEIARLVFPVYFNMNLSASRTFPRIITYNTSSETGEENYRYYDQFSVSPALRQTYTFPTTVITQPSLSWALSTPLQGSYKEKLISGYASDADGKQDALNQSYRTDVTLTNKWVDYRYTKQTHLLESKVTYGFQQQLDLLYRDTATHAGIVANTVGLSADYDMGKILHMAVSSSYDVLESEDKSFWYDPFADPSFNGRWTLTDRDRINWQGTYKWEVGKINSAYVSINHTSLNWNANLNLSYSMIIDQDDTTGIVNSTSDSLIMTLNAGFRPKGWNLNLKSNLQYNITEKEFTNLGITVARDVHCWNLQGGFKIYSDGNINIGFGISVKAFPEVNAGFGGY